MERRMIASSRDRKSTRLNSSHGYISYAVFCLKKKTANKVEAIKWYTKSATQGFIKAEYNLAIMYDEGDGVAENNAEAIKWYLKAANQGDTAAQFNLALMYDKGEGTTINKGEAIKWFGKAADGSYFFAMFNLHRILHSFPTRRSTD